MKKLFSLFTYSPIIFLLVSTSGCQLAGLDLQENYEYKQRVLDPKINQTAYEFLTVRNDTVFSLMQQAIQYAGVNPEEYTAPNRTFVLLHNLAIIRYDTRGRVDPNCYFGRNLVNGRPGTKWQDYPVEKVRALLLYHIIEGEYSFENLGPDNVTATTLLPNANNTVLLKVTNDRDSKIRFNDFFNSVKFVVARTGGIRPTNGVIHIVDNYVEYGVK